MRSYNIHILFIIMVLLFTGQMAVTGQKPSDGHGLYTKHCTGCHGENGAKGVLFAKNLHKSTLKDDAIVKIISGGKGFMPSFKKKLTAAQIAEVAEYVKLLRK